MIRFIVRDRAIRDGGIADTKSLADGGYEMPDARGRDR